MNTDKLLIQQVIICLLLPFHNERSNGNDYYSQNDCNPHYQSNNQSSLLYIIYIAIVNLEGREGGGGIGWGITLVQVYEGEK